MTELSVAEALRVITDKASVLKALGNADARDVETLEAATLSGMGDLGAEIAALALGVKAALPFEALEAPLPRR